MKLKVTVSPDPFISEFVVLIRGEITLNMVICLVNDQNTIICMSACALKPGENKIKMSNLQQCSSGQYCLHIKLLNGDLVEKIQLAKI